MRRSWCAVAAALMTTAAIAPAAQASFPGPNGRVSFARYDDQGFEQLWTANPDLSGLAPLTQVPGTNSISSAWAPDGSRIAFDSDRAGGVDVYTIKPDGTDLRKLTDHGFNGEPSYSPDGRYILFEHDEGDLVGEGIYRMRPDGSQVRKLVGADQTSGLITAGPRYSPDGAKIAFTVLRHPRDGKPGRAWDLAGATGAVFLMDADGSRPRRLTAWGHVTGPDVDWSPDGRWLAFETDFHNGNGPDIYIVRPDGKALRNLTDNATLTPKRLSFSSDPAWAPDGSRILFTQAGIFDDAFSLDLWSVRPDGTDMKPVAGHTEAWEDQPAWGIAPLK
jgi:Tol biopolymer transport system component